MAGPLARLQNKSPSPATIAAARPTDPAPIATRILLTNTTRSTMIAFPFHVSDLLARRLTFAVHGERDMLVVR